MVRPRSQGARGPTFFLARAGAPYGLFAYAGGAGQLGIGGEAMQGKLGRTAIAVDPDAESRSVRWTRGLYSEGNACHNRTND